MKLIIITASKCIWRRCGSAWWFVKRQRDICVCCLTAVTQLWQQQRRVIARWHWHTSDSTWLPTGELDWPFRAFMFRTSLKYIIGSSEKGCSLNFLRSPLWEISQRTLHLTVSFGFKEDQRTQRATRRADSSESSRKDSVPPAQCLERLVLRNNLHFSAASCGHMHGPAGTGSQTGSEYVLLIICGNGLKGGKADKDFLRGEECLCSFQVHVWPT